VGHKQDETVSGPQKQTLFRAFGKFADFSRFGYCPAQQNKKQNEDVCMSSYLYKGANYETQKPLKRFLTWLRVEAGYIPGNFRREPFSTTAKLSGVALLTAAAGYVAHTAAMIPTNLHTRYIRSQGNEALARHNPLPVNLSVLWVAHSGQAVAGHAELAEPKNKLDAITNKGLASLGKTGDAEVACRTIEFKEDPDSSVLRYIFRDTVKVDSFDNADIQKSGLYTCVPHAAPAAKP
jgi:hypothetical protein